MSLFFHQLWGSRETLNVTWRGKKDRIDSIYWRIPAGDSIVFAARTPLSFFIYLSLSFRCHGDTVWIKTWHIVEFSSRSMHPGKDSPHAILLGLRASVLRVFLHFGRILLHPRGTSATLLPDLQWNRSIQTLVFGERNVYTLKRVVWDNEGYSRRETSQDYVNLKMIHLFMR